MGYTFLSKVESASIKIETLNKIVIRILKLMKRRLPKENQTAMSYEMVLKEAICKLDKIDFDRIKL